MKLHYLKRFYPIKLLRGWHQSKKMFRWDEILEKDRHIWEPAFQASANGPAVLLATSMGGYLPGTMIDSMLSVALTLRGANVHILLCDSLLPVCQLCDYYLYPNQNKFLKHGPKRDICVNCFEPARQIFSGTGVKVHKYSDFLTEDDIKSAKKISEEICLNEIGNFKQNGVGIGEQALAGALRFFARGDLSNEPHSEHVLRKYLLASILSATATERLIKKFDIECVSAHHGIYVPQGLIGDVCRNNNVRIVNWHVAYRKKCFIFSHDDTYHHTLMSEPIEKWENIPWNNQLESDITNYLESRWYGTKDWIKFNDKPENNLSSIAKNLGVDFSKTCIGLLTNVVWDAQLHYPANAFPNMLEWIMQTISYFEKRQELQLIIRVHPAEIAGMLPSRQRVVEEIRKKFPNLPKNVFIIPPDSNISTYVVMNQCNAVIIYGTKTGVELTSMGIPVVVAGEAWIRNKGVTMDATSSTDYFELLDKLPLNRKIDVSTVRRARKYAYHFFFRRMIPLSFVEPADKFYFKFNLTELNELLPGKDPGLDVICNGIINGTDFIYPAEKFVLSKRDS